MGTIPGAHQECAALIETDLNQFPRRRHAPRRNHFKLHLMRQDVLLEDATGRGWLRHLARRHWQYLVLQPLRQFQIALYQKRTCCRILWLNSTGAWRTLIELRDGVI